MKNILKINTCPYLSKFICILQTSLFTLFRWSSNEVKDE